MKRIHLVRVEEGADRFGPLIEAVRRDGGRVGWLELGGGPEIPASLAPAAGLGVLRAVTVGPAHTVAVKPRAGNPVLRDLVREHFRGCRLVLVAGAADLPLLRSVDDGWRVSVAGRDRDYTTDTLSATLRRPHPWGRDEG